MIKHVVNDNGGTAVAGDFTMPRAAGPTRPRSPGAERRARRSTLDAGSYSVTEDAAPGYAASFSADCSGSLAPGQTKTCTVTNDDRARQADRDQARRQRRRRQRRGRRLHAARRRAVVRGPGAFPGESRYDVPRRRQLRGDRGRARRLRGELLRPTAPARSRTARRRPAPSRTTTRADSSIVIKHVVNDNGGTRCRRRLHDVRQRLDLVPGRGVARHDPRDPGRLVRRRRDRPLRLRRVATRPTARARSPTARRRPAR